MAENKEGEQSSFIPHLEIVAGPRKGDTVSLSTSPITIGRTQANTLCLDDPLLSRQHAQIDKREDIYWLVDLDSHNGTYLNGLRLEAPHQLGDQDQIRVGSSLLVVHLLEDVPDRIDTASDQMLRTLSITKGPLQGSTFLLDDLTIGRSEDNDITLNDSLVSSHHACVERRDEGVWIVD